MNKLFVYGIFLDEHNRRSYGMSHPKYATVKGFVTFGYKIVQAYMVDNPNTALTGLLVDVDERYWPMIDRLEHGYDRIEILTTDNERAYMYVGRDEDE